MNENKNKNKKSEKFKIKTSAALFKPFTPPADRAVHSGSLGFSTKDRAFRIALCGVITAMAVGVMFLSFIPAMAYTMPAAAGIMLAAVRIHINRGWALLSYVAASLLTLILVAAPEAQMLFVLLLGYYPIVKTDIDSKFKPVAAWIIKLAIFNVAAVLVYNGGKFILGITDALSGLEFFGKYAVYAFWAESNLTFWLYDRCVSVVLMAYGTLLMPKIERQR
ncbi:hypothetical protein FACS1894120_2760 [Clostridia bacterium]|nr:hypothetical protein FACS1894120_2760 [Clostridia bacterium]